VARFPAPFGHDFPNLDRALTENVPVLCTLLVGFIGLLFVTVATLSDIDKSFHEVVYRPLLVWGPALFSASGRSFTLRIAGLDCLLFYLAVLSIIYARMSEYRDLVTDDRLTELRKDQLFVNEQARLDRRRRRYVTTCMIFFNCAVSSLPLAFLPITHQRWHQGFVIDVVAVVLLFSFWSNRQRLPDLFR
jgi:hypothetical protein